jgi:hypothetical protein
MKKGGYLNSRRRYREFMEGNDVKMLSEEGDGGDEGVAISMATTITAKKRATPGIGLIKMNRLTK